MKKPNKFLFTLLACLCIGAFSVGVSACEKQSNNQSNTQSSSPNTPDDSSENGGNNTNENSSGNNNNSDTNSGDTDDVGGGNNEDSGNGNNDGEQTNKIDPTQITHATPFSEGYAFVNINKDYSTDYCIDKQGNIIFSLNVGVAYQSTGFYNGICAFGSDWEEMSICDKTGKTTTAEDLGGTTIPMLTNHEGLTAAFQDGYFFVQKEITTFTDSVIKTAIYNAKLQKLVDFSEELTELYQYFCGSHYYKGYLYTDYYEVLDLNTGKQVQDAGSLLNTLKLDYASDFWRFSSDCKYYDILSNLETAKIDISQYSETLYDASEFKNGLAYLIFNSNNTYFFTILLENGLFAFDPVQLEGSTVKVATYGDKFFVSTIGNGIIKFQVFDKNGLRNESFSCESDAIECRLEVHNDIVLATFISPSFKVSYEYYNLDFTKLFD